MIGNLTKTEIKSMEMRFGFNGHTKSTFSSIGKELNISSDDARETLNKAIISMYKSNKCDGHSDDLRVLLERISDIFENPIIEFVDEAN